MGFNKRYIGQQTIVRSDNIDKLFSADVLIIEDKWSSKFIELYKKGYDKETIIKLLENGVDKELKNI
jgi:hypothetical protein